MDHLEPDELAVLALDAREPDDAVRAHLAECARCRAEYDAFARTAALGRAGAADARPEAPSASVWAGIHGELGLSPELAPDPLASPPVADAAPPAPVPISTARRTSSDSAAGTDASARGRRSPRRTRWAIGIAATIGALLVGVGAGIAVAGLGGWGFGGAPSAPPATVLADAVLAPFPGWAGATGHATVEEDAAGVRSIVVDMDAVVPSGDVREVWLIRSDASGLVSLGLLDGDSGRFPVPAGIDLAEYSLVDVSAEPVDGDPAHSGDSIVRGELVRS